MPAARRRSSRTLPLVAHVQRQQRGERQRDRDRLNGWLDLARPRRAPRPAPRAPRRAGRGTTACLRAGSGRPPSGPGRSGSRATVRSCGPVALDRELELPARRLEVGLPERRDAQDVGGLDDEDVVAVAVAGCCSSSWPNSVVCREVRRVSALSASERNSGGAGVDPERPRQCRGPAAGSPTCRATRSPSTDEQRRQQRRVHVQLHCVPVRPTAGQRSQQLQRAVRAGGRPARSRAAAGPPPPRGGTTRRPARRRRPGRSARRSARSPARVARVDPLQRCRRSAGAAGAAGPG